MAPTTEHRPASPPQELLDARLATVIEHADAEARRDLDGALATFARPRYELPGDEVVDGLDAVAAHYRTLFSGFPDLCFPPAGAGTTLHHVGDSVLMQTRMCGTHAGSLGGLPPTGRRIDLAMVALFDFEEADLVCERVFLDRLTLLAQLGLARDPNTTSGRIATVLNHPLALSRAALRSAFGPRSRPSAHP